MAKSLAIAILIFIGINLATANPSPAECYNWIHQLPDLNSSMETLCARLPVSPPPVVPQIVWGLKAAPLIFDVVLHATNDQKRKNVAEKELVVSVEDFTPCFEGSHDTPTTYKSRYHEIYALGEGYFGKTSLAVPHCTTMCPKPNLVLKEAKVKENPDAYDAALREEYFGKRFRSISRLLQGANHLPRMVESFGKPDQFYFISMFEGISLHSALYKSESLGITHQWWKWLKTTPEGKIAMQDIMKQLISGLALLHRWNITHRDLKPDNIVICFYTSDGDCIGKPTIGLAYKGLHVRLIDFGSALDEYSGRYLYGNSGPTTNTQDFRYTSPECFFDEHCLKVPNAYLSKYDMFSVGLIYMEMILMTPHVLSKRNDTRFLDICVGWTELPPHCRSEISFLKYIKARDPMKIGFPGIRALRFAQRLLNVDIDTRLSAEKALKNAYFS